LKIVGIIFALFLALLSGGTYAAESGRTEAQVQLELLNNLERDGFLSKKLSAEAKVKYLDPKQLAAPGKSAQTTTAAPEDSLWSRYVTWWNFIKVLAVILFLIVIGGTVRNIIKGIWPLLAKVPVIVYQLPLLAVSGYATLMPQAFWASQSFYVALLASFSNIIVVGWILAMYPKFAKALASLFKLGIPVASVASFWLMLYFGALAIHYQSLIFGFFTAISLSAVLSFGLYYSRGTLYLDFNDKALHAVVFGHLAVLGAYVFMKANGFLPAYAEVFVSGIEYYCTVALCVGLLCGASPWSWEKDSIGGMSLLFILVFFGAMAGYFFLDLHVIGSIISCFFILFVLEWMAKFGYSGGMIAGSAVMGTALYGCALLMEKYGSFIVLQMV
jgi:hypothetical protein